MAFTAYSAWQVLKDPKNPANWAALGADLVCLVVPVATGGGAAVRAASKADDVIDVGKTINRVDNIADAEGAASKGKGFNSYRQLKRHIGSAGGGNEWHHIVEQNQISKSGFNVQAIQNTNNIISIDKNTHRAISGYYSSIQPFTQGKIVRNWLVGQSFEKQYQFGVDVIKMFI